MSQNHAPGFFTRYVSIWTALFRTSFVADLEYRANLTVKIFTDLLWYFAQFLTFEVLYKHTDIIAGWQLAELRLFMFMLFVTDAIYMVMFSENLDQLPQKVVKGELDLLLAKPVDSQFMLSFMKFNTAYCANLILVTFGFFWAMTQLPSGIPWLKLPILLIVIPCGVCVMYSTRLFFAASSIYFGNTSQLMMLWFQLYRLGTRPDIFYPPWMRYIVLGFIPMGFIASVPSRIIIEPWSWWLPISSVAMGVFLFSLSRWYWKLAIKNYSSASS